MKVKVYATLRMKTGQAEIEVNAGPGDRVRDAISQVLELYPHLAPDVITADGDLVGHVHVFLSGRNVRLLDGLNSVIQDGHRLDIFPPVGGGRCSVQIESTTTNTVGGTRDPVRSAT